MNPNSQIIMVEGIFCNNKITNKVPIKVNALKFIGEINYNRYKIKDYNCSLFLKILKTDKDKIEEKLYIDELEYDEFNDSLLLYAMAKSGNPKAIKNLITFIERENLNGKIFLVTQEDDVKTYEEGKTDIYWL